MGEEGGEEGHNGNTAIKQLKVAVVPGEEREKASSRWCLNTPANVFLLNSLPCFCSGKCLGHAADRKRWRKTTTKEGTERKQSRTIRMEGGTKKTTTTTTR